jgi:hypothetical protein
VESHENQGSTFSFKLPKKGLIWNIYLL